MKKILLLLFFGLSANTVFASCENLTSSYESYECIKDDFEKNEKIVNWLYDTVYNSQYYADYPNNLDAERKKALKKSQSAWLSYRKAYCSDYMSVASYGANGVGSSVAYLSCANEITSNRLEELLDEAHNIEGVVLSEVVDGILGD